MFERKNQNILSAHYSKLIDHEDAGEEDDFITLKRADHDLDLPASNEPDPDTENLSKRKLKLSRTKRMVVKHGHLNHKLVFDDEGNPHEIYEMVNPDEFYKHGADAVKEAGRTFVEGEKGKLKSADIADKQEAKEKKREKKRRRKERERGVSESVPRTCSIHGPFPYRWSAREMRLAPRLDHRMNVTMAMLPPIMVYLRGRKTRRRLRQSESGHPCPNRHILRGLATLKMKRRWHYGSCGRNEPGCELMFYGMLSTSRTCPWRFNDGRMPRWDSNGTRFVPSPVGASELCQYLGTSRRNLLLL